MKRSIIAWCFYDWANSAFSAVILTFVFAAYFTEKIAANNIVGTSDWGLMIAISGLTIAIASPILGSIADRKKRHKPWIFIFTLLSVITSGLLWFAKPMPNSALFTLYMVGISLISMEIAIVFYNAMLKIIAPPDHLGRLSGWGWGLGYFGGLCCLSIALFVFIEGKPSWLNTNPHHLEQIRIIGPLVAIWFAVFSIPLFLFTKDESDNGMSMHAALSEGIWELWDTLKSLRHHKHILLFLIAHMLYIDGLNTIFAFGGIYAAGTFGMTVNDVIKFGIAMNIAAGIGAAGFAWLDDFLGSKPTILIALLIMIGMAIGMLTVTSVEAFWILGMGLSISVGPTQAASRSLMAHIAPKETVTQLFGLYSLSGKVTTFIGPWILALLTAHYSSQRVGMSTVIYFLAAGGILLCFVKPKNSHATDN